MTAEADGTCSPAYLCTAGPGYDGPTGLGTPNGPAAFITGGGPGDEIAFQASNGHLWIDGSAVTGDTGLAMMPGTSPALTDLPPENNPWYPNGGLEAVFQGSDGHPWDYSPSGGGGLMSSSAMLAPGTSPAIVPTPAGPGGWQALWQGANNHLWTTGAGPTDTGLTMKPGTSPALTELPPENNPWYPNGGIEAVFQGSDGHPWDYSPSGGGGLMSSSAFLAPGTSLTTVPTPAGPGGWQALWQGANNHLWTTGAGPTDTGLTMMPGTSPDITALS